MTHIQSVGYIRPLNKHDNEATAFRKGKNSTATRCISVDEEDKGRLTLQDPLGNKTYSFHLDEIFDSAQQSDLFECVVPLLEDAVDGINASIFAYGGMGTGKTRVMLGYDLWKLAQKKVKLGSSSPGKQPVHQQPTSEEAAALMSKSFDVDAGIILRSMKWLLEKKNSLKKTGVCDMKIVVSYFEIHSEEIFDLLKVREKASELYMYSATPRSPTSRSPKDTHPDVRQYPDGSTVISGLVEVEISSMEDVMHILWAGAKSRSAVAADLVDYGARTSTVFCANLKMNFSDSDMVQAGKIMFVDLSGVGGHKNKGLTVLGKVLNALQEGNSLDKRTKNKVSASKTIEETSAEEDHRTQVDFEGGASPEGSPAKASPSRRPLIGIVVPYRESKLTRVLTDYLGKKARTLFFCTISPAGSCFAESLRTLQFAESACRIKLQSSPSLSNYIPATKIEYDGGLVNEATSPGLADENCRLKLLSRFLFNALGRTEHGTSADRECASADGMDLLSILISTSDAEGGDKGLINTMRMSLMKAKNENQDMEEELTALRSELARERREKEEICQLIYSADTPQLQEVLDLEINSDDDKGSVARMEKQYYQTSGVHGDPVLLREFSTSCSVGGEDQPVSPAPTTYDETKCADATDDRVSSMDSPASLPHPPEKNAVSTLRVMKPAFPKDKKVDFELQSALLGMERQALARQRALITDWTKSEEERWSFVRQSVREQKTEIDCALEKIVTQVSELKDADADADADALKEKFEGLKERVELMELSLRAHEVSMQTLQSYLGRASSKA